ncbi:MAG: undecaprenyl/decaprenyl-phosphate alpha-N-acetylglucosaminyl 1-phosphate transferase, partial [Anaerolineae bacterium]
DHTSHRLVRMGYSRREAVLILYLAGVVLGVVAMYLTQATVTEGYVMGGTVLAVGIYFLYRFEHIDTSDADA